MLATQRMSSHAGQLPFGYNSHEVHGIGLPEFMIPNHPMGPSILTDDENQHLDSFFTNFDLDPHQQMPQQYPAHSAPQMQFGMPPTYFGHETRRGPGTGIEPHNMQMDGQFQFFGNQMLGHHMQTMNSQQPFPQHMQHFPHQSHSYTEPLINELQSAAATVQPPQPGFTHDWNQQIQPQSQPLQMPGRGPMMRFGSDSHFTQTGFQAPTGLISPNETQDMPWLESRPGTQPNTRPNTQPSSPNLFKKRKFDNYQIDRRNGFHTANGHIAQPHHSQLTHQRKRSAIIKSDPSQPATPLTASRPQSSHSAFDAQADTPLSSASDALAESDDDPSSAHPTANPSRPSSPPAFWPANKARPPKSNKPPLPPKPSKKRKKPSVSTETPASKSKAPPKPTRTPSSRVPLTTAQKKANHTYSEQRRRDTTAHAYAELYDLVPELSANMKLSTMKKLELVVDKVRSVTQRVEYLRRQLGIVAGGSIQTIAESQGLSPDFGGPGMEQEQEHEMAQYGDSVYPGFDDEEGDESGFVQ